MERRDVTAQILDAKRAQGLSFTQIAERVGADRVWLTAALLGQHPLSADQAAAIVEMLESDAGPRVCITLDGKFLPYQWGSGPGR